MQLFIRTILIKTIILIVKKTKQIKNNVLIILNGFFVDKIKQNLSYNYVSQQHNIEYDYLLEFQIIIRYFHLIFLNDSIVLDSKRSDECIDFKMMCVFFCVSVYSKTSRNNTQISNSGGGFRCKSEYPWCIIEVKNKHFRTVFKKLEKNKKKKKMTEKREFLRKTIQIFTKSVENAKICNISRRYLKILPFLIIQILTKICQIPEYLQIILTLHNNRAIILLVVLTSSGQSFKFESNDSCHSKLMKNLGQINFIDTSKMQYFRKIKNFSCLINSSKK
ncbi:Uncharacterized protein FWK35_00004737, partial [Aphis craccivora]